MASARDLEVVLVCDTLDRTNWGCRATSSAMRQLVAERATLLGAIDYRAFRHRRRPGFRWLDAARPTDAALRVRAPAVRVGGRGGEVGGVRHRTRSLLEWGISSIDRPGSQLEPATVADFDRTWDRWRSSDLVADLVAMLERCDVVVVNGEGAVRPAPAAGRFGFFLAWAAKERLGKEVAIVNHMCDLSNPTMRSFAEAVYPVVDSVVTRGRASLAVAAPLCAPGVARAAPDAAFLHRPARRDAFLEAAGRPGYHATYPSSTEGFDPAAPYVCLGGSARYQDGSSIDADTVEWFGALVAGLRTRAQVLLLGHDYPDHALFAEISRRDGVPFVGVQTPVPQALDLLAHATAYLGGRWHSAVLAASGGTPVVPLTSNSGVKSEDQRDFVVTPVPTFSLEHRPAVGDVLAVVDDVLGDEPELRRRGLERVDGYAAATAAQVAVLEAPVAAR
jgi:hypothetical protein